MMYRYFQASFFFAFTSLLTAVITMPTYGEAKGLRNMTNKYKQSSLSKEEYQRFPQQSQKRILHAYMEPSQTQRWESYDTTSTTYAGITLTFNDKDSDEMDISYFLNGGPANCRDCLISIHKGNECSSPNVRYFKNTDKVRRNPWTKKSGAIISTNEVGKGVGTIKAFSNGLLHHENESHVVVIYDNSRVNASRKSQRAKVVACGVLKNVSQ